MTGLAVFGYIAEAALAAAGLSIRVGIPVNNHPHIRRRMAGETFGAIQVRRTTKRGTAT